MTELEDLIATAVVGTARRPPVDVLVVGGIAIDQPPHDLSPAQAMLAAAALAAAGSRAGRTSQAVSSDSGSQPHPPEERDPAPGPAVQLLELVLDGRISRAAGPLLLTHWLAHCVEAGRRVPHRLLPRLLAHPAPDESRALLAEAIGARGRWLAAKHPEWSQRLPTGPATSDWPGDDPQRWSALSPAARDTVLRQTRRRDPAAGLALVRATWDRDAAAARERHLRALAIDLGPGDEELVVAALDDRSRRVRELAAELLIRLPDSDWASQVLAQVEPVVHAAGRAGTVGAAGPRLLVELTSEIPGIDDPPPGRSRHGYQLELVAALSPLARWSELSGRSAAELAAAAEPDDVVRGWCTAAAWQADREWATALLQARPALALDPDRSPSPLEALDQDTAERLVGAIIEPLRAAEALTLAAAVGSTTDPWSAAFSRLVVSRIAAAGNEAVLPPEHHDLLASRLDPSVTPELQRWHDGLGVKQRRSNARIREILRILSTRAAIADAFASDG